MGIETLIMGGASLLSGAMSNRSARRASQQQVDAQQAAVDENRRQFNIAQENQRPFIEAGTNALSRIQSELNSSAYDRYRDDSPEVPVESYDNFTADRFQVDPGYQFRLQEGERGLNNRLLASGKFFSGSALRDGIGYNQGMASQEFGNAFNRYQAEQGNRLQRSQLNYGNQVNRANNRFNQLQVDRSNRLAPWQAMAGQGQQSTAQLNALGSQYAGMNGQLMSNQGDARAAGTIGRNNAITDTMNSMFSIFGRGMGGGSNIPDSSTIRPPTVY